MGVIGSLFGLPLPAGGEAQSARQTAHQPVNAGGAPRTDRAHDSVLSGQIDASLENGMLQMIASLDGLADLESRLSELEASLVGESDHGLDDLPSAHDLGIHCEAIESQPPRLLDAALLMGAIVRRAQLRVGCVERALGLMDREHAGVRQQS